MSKSAFEKRVSGILHNLKHGIADSRAPASIPVWKGREICATMKVIDASSIERGGDVELLAKWRQEHEWWFPAQFKVTKEGTKTWLEKGVICNPERILFFLENPEGEKIGHLGFFRFDYEKKRCEVDNIVRGEAKVPGVMTPALRALMMWGLGVLQLEGYSLRVFSENERAVSLYKRCGFTEGRRIPLEKKVSEDGTVSWEETSDGAKAERYFLEMEYFPFGKSAGE